MTKPTSKLIHGDSQAILPTLEPNSVDAIVTDPPAGISFIGKEWDSDKGGRDQWIAWLQTIAIECFRVAKPGSHALVWAIPRTSHWTGMAWENAGWECREKVYHMFSAGFPKSHNVQKSVQKLTGSNLAAAEYEGYGTTLKPTVEEWWLFRKPLEGTIAENMLKYGVGALNIDANRIKTDEKLCVNVLKGWSGFGQEKRPEYVTVENNKGRWPTQLVHDGSPEVTSLFPGKNETSIARCYYCAKPNKRDRNEGCEENTHVTVKSTELMTFLCKLITPIGGIILDPFMGSGSTGKAAIKNGFSFIGIEKEKEYFTIAEKRIKFVEPKDNVGDLFEE